MTTLSHHLYFKRQKDLPAPLPTALEILASKDVIKGVGAQEARKVVGVGKYYIAKYSRYNDHIEGQNLLFLEQNNLHGFAPLLYAMWTEADGTLFLVMGRMRGDTLEALWPTLQEPDKCQILSQVRDILTSIRSIPNQHFFGSVDKSHVAHHLFYWPDYPIDISGPFITERGLIQGLILKLRSNAKENGRHSYFADFFQNELIGSLTVEGRVPVFTHSDLQRKNILVDVIEKDDGKGFRVSLVDWESAGWYPVYWEYFAAFLAFKWDDDWCNRVTEIVDGWPSETAMMKMIYQELLQ